MQPDDRLDAEIQHHVDLLGAEQSPHQQMMGLAFQRANGYSPIID